MVTVCRLRHCTAACRHFSFVLAVCLGAACALAPDAAPPEPAARPVPDPPGDWFDAPAGAHEPFEWWRAFADPVLDEVVETALTSSFGMVEAVARVRQARVQAHRAEAAILPTVGVRAGVDTFEAPVDAGIGAQLQELGLDDALEGLDGFTLPERLGITTYTLNADFAYELDFWDRVRHASLAAGAELLAAESDARAARMGILAETITAYFDIVDLRRQIRIARETVDVLREREQLAETRYGRGLGDSLDLYRVREDLRDAQSGLPQLDSRLAEAEGRLAVLLGGYGEDVAEVLPDTLSPARPAEPVPAGVPADLLAQRPDVRAARGRLEAAGHDIEARRAALRPSLSFSGSIGLQTTDVAGLFDVRQWFGNLVSNLLAPAFDGGRLRSDVALARARFDERAAAYGRTVVTAVNEVEAAMAGLRNESRRHVFLGGRREEARATLELRSERYAAGLGGYADVLDARRTLLNVESARAGSERSLALARLAVHRALGGTWTAPADDAAARAWNAASAVGSEGTTE